MTTVTELIAQLNKISDKSKQVVVAWSVGEGRYRTRSDVSVKPQGEYVHVAGESREPKPAKSTTKKTPAAKTAAPVKSAAKKTTAKKTPAKKTTAKNATKR